MRAVVVREFGGPEVLRVEEAPDPRPGPGELLVRVGAAGVNPVDTYIRGGAYAIKPDLPYTPGSDGAGEVVALGEGVSRVAVGARVYFGGGSGAYAELARVPAERAWPLPERLSFEQGAAVATPYATAYRALHDKAAARPGEWLLVHGGSGAVGTAVAQLARAHGMRVVGTAGSEPGREVALQAGCEEALDHRDPDHMRRALELTDGRGFDVVVELLANVNLADDLRALARFGRVVVVGNRGTIEINPRDLMSRDGRIEAFVLFNASGDDLRRIHAHLGAGFANGTLSPAVDRAFRLEEAPAAHRAVIEASHQGKIVLTPRL